MKNATELRETVLQAATAGGADLVGIAPAERIADPALAKIFPSAKSVIVIAFRVLRGSLRGIEEGTTYYQYTTTGLETLEETMMPAALLRISAVLEDAGYLALPQRRNQMLKDSEHEASPEMLHTAFYPAGAKEPKLDFVAAAVAAGLGERGKTGSLLTDRFGPLQRLALVLTDAEIAPDAVAKPHLCDGCGQCVAACPGHAIGEDGRLDTWQCAAYYRGANQHTNPYMPPDAYPAFPDARRREIMDGTARLSEEEARTVMEETYFYPPMKHGYVASVCGRACDRACYAHLEEIGALQSAFVHPFRSRPVWSLPLVYQPKED